jgi:UTP--glucose-1-phosphate uridylyltransferase
MAACKIKVLIDTLYRQHQEDCAVEVRKAVITAAGRGVRLYPVADTVQKGMLPLMDRDGLTKPVIQIIIEEALDSGIEEICIVCAPGDEERYRAQMNGLRTNLLEGYPGEEWAHNQAGRLENLLQRLSFAMQEDALGYGHAVYCARHFVGSAPFLLLLGDHLYLSDEPDKRCAAQLIELAEQEQCAVAAVNPTREYHVGHYGTVSGKRLSELPGVYQIEKIIEKPSISLAESELQTPGLRTGHYLCFFGMHVLPPSLFPLIEEELKRSGQQGGGCQLTPTLQELALRERYLAAELRGTRYDIGARYGLLLTQLALGLAGNDRDAMQREILELLLETRRVRDTKTGSIS